MNNGNIKREEFQKGTGGALQSGAAGVMEQAKQAVTHVAGEVTEQAKDKVNTAIDTQKEKAAGSLGGVAEALRETGRSLREHEMPVEYVDRAADQIERIGHYVRSRTIGELVGDAEAFARREPALFLGGSFTLGLLAARFLKSSTPHDDASETSPGMSRGTGNMETRIGGIGRTRTQGQGMTGQTSSQRERSYGARDTDDNRPTQPNAQKPPISPSTQAGSGAMSQGAAKPNGSDTATTPGGAGGFSHSTSPGIGQKAEQGKGGTGGTGTSGGSRGGAGGL